VKHEHRLIVRSYECDVNGHVNNAIYLNYLEAARVEFLRAGGITYRELRERGFGLMVARLCIDFKDEARMDDPLIIVTEPVKKRFTGGTFSQKVFREEGDGRRLLADAEVVWVCVGREKRPVKVPPFLDTEALQPAGPAAV
jgi:acyl-CoA thioester hydrolase